MMMAFGLAEKLLTKLLLLSVRRDTSIYQDN